MPGPASSSGRRADATIAAALTAVALVVRFWNLSAVGLTHFDEGAYTTTGRWLATLGREGAPFQPIFSPPLFPAVVGAAFSVFGVRDVVAVAVSAVAGSLTVGFVTSLGCAWFGRWPGVVAGLALAFAEYHVVYSRLALTDATFALLFWASLAALYAAGASGRRRDAVLAGVLVGCCWLTKYHGFLPLVIAAAWCLPHSRSAFVLRRIALAGVAAAAVYLPWAAYVQATIGYGRLLATHVEHSLGRGLFVTPPGAIAFDLTHWLAWPVLALAGAGLVAAAFESRDEARFVAVATLLFLASATLYLSFPRLVLPAVPGLCLLAGVGVDAIARRARRLGPVVVAAGAALVAAPSWPPVAALLATHTDAYREAAEYVASTGRPAITELSKNAYFYERQPSLEVRFHTAAELDAALETSGEVLVVVDPLVERLPDARAWIGRVVAGRTPERVFLIGLYEPVVYQGFDPRTPLRQVPRSIAPFRLGDARIEVYRINGSEAPP